MTIEMTGISFSYGAVEALRDVDFTLDRGEVVALVGDNGAGKSTLIKVLSGVLKPDAGTIRMDGREVAFATPMDAREAGISTLYQDLSLLDNLDVATNLFVGREQTTAGGFLRFGDTYSSAKSILDRYSIRAMDAGSLVQNLSGGQRQIVALARAVDLGSRYVIFDEPTSALGPAAAEEVLEVVRNLAGQGFGVVVITHNVNHAFRVAHRIVVMRLGEIVGSRLAEDTSPAEIVSMIVGAGEFESEEAPR